MLYTYNSKMGCERGQESKPGKHLPFAEVEKFLIGHLLRRVQSRAFEIRCLSLKLPNVPKAGLSHMSAVEQETAGISHDYAVTEDTRKWHSL